MKNRRWHQPKSPRRKHTKFVPWKISLKLLLLDSPFILRSSLNDKAMTVSDMSSELKSLLTFPLGVKRFAIQLCEHTLGASLIASSTVEPYVSESYASAEQCAVLTCRLG